MAKRLIPTLVTSSLVASALVLASTTPALADDAPTPVLGVTSSSSILQTITAQAVSPDGKYYFAAGTAAGTTVPTLAVEDLTGASPTVKTFQLSTYSAILSLAVGQASDPEATGNPVVPTLFLGGTAASSGDGVVKTYAISEFATIPQSSNIASGSFPKTTSDLLVLGSTGASPVTADPTKYQPDIIVPSPVQVTGTDGKLKDAFYVTDSSTGAVFAYRRTAVGGPTSYKRMWRGTPANDINGDIAVSSDGTKLFASGSSINANGGAVYIYPTSVAGEASLSGDQYADNNNPVSTPLSFPVHHIVPSQSGAQLFLLGSGVGSTASAPTWVAESVNSSDLSQAVAPTTAAAGQIIGGALTSDGGQIYTALLDKSGNSSLLTLSTGTLAAAPADPAIPLQPSTVSIVAPTDGSVFYAASASTGYVQTIGKALPITGPSSVSLTGDAAVGGTLTLSASPSQWTPATVTLSCQWYVNGQPFFVTTGCSFSPSIAQQGDAVYGIVTASQPGYLTQTVQTNTVTIAKGTMTASGNPVITGTAKFGSTLKITLPKFGPAISGFAPTYSYQWYANGETLKAVASRKSTYTPTSATLLGKTMTVAVTAHAAGFNDLTVTSAATKPLAPGPLIAKTPTLIGSAKVGTTLVANHGSWGPGTVHFIYRWYANGKLIPGKTTSKLKVSKIWIGKQIRVKVYGTETGFVKTSKTSAYKKPHK